MITTVSHIQCNTMTIDDLISIVCSKIMHASEHHDRYISNGELSDGCAPSVTDW
jgi:hypothetical protein